MSEVRLTYKHVLQNQRNNPEVRDFLRRSSTNQYETSGQGSKNRKLSSKEVIMIYLGYMTRGKTPSVLAKEYEIDRASIYRIIKREDKLIKAAYTDFQHKQFLRRKTA